MTSLERGLRIGDLISSRVIDADGRNLGKVVDIRVTADGRYDVLELLVGSSGWLDRLNLGRLFRDIDIREPDHIPWNRVDRFENATIYLKDPATESGTG
jgi:sporulation protein YlmC with PRC-barrel domain